MELLYQTAVLEFGNPPPLPASLQGASLREANTKRADYLRYIQEQVTDDVRIVQAHLPGINHLQQCPLLATRLKGNTALLQRAGLFLDDVTDANARINISLRLYAGYLDTAKTIAWGVTGRKNTTARRQLEIQQIEARAMTDHIYLAGVEVAPHYKWRVLREGIYRDGIPLGAIVLRDWDD